MDDPALVDGGGRDLQVPHLPAASISNVSSVVAAGSPSRRRAPPADGGFGQGGVGEVVSPPSGGGVGGRSMRPKRDGGNWKLPPFDAGSVRTTGVVEAASGAPRTGRSPAGDVDTPFGTHLRVRRVLWFRSTMARYEVRHDEEPHREQEQQGCGEPGSRRASDLLPGGTGQALDRPIRESSPRKHESRSLSARERSAEQQEGRGDEDQRVDLTGPRLRRRPGPQLEERETPRRQDEQLQWHPREERTVLPRCRLRSSRTVPRHVRDRESEEDTPPTTAATSRATGGGVQDGWGSYPREIGSVRGAREPPPGPSPGAAERNCDDRSEDRLDALGASNTLRPNPRLCRTASSNPAGERKCAHTGQHGECDGADLEYNEQDRHGQIGDPLPNDVTSVTSPVTR